MLVMMVHACGKVHFVENELQTCTQLMDRKHVCLCHYFAHLKELEGDGNAYLHILLKTTKVSELIFKFCGNIGY